VSERAGVKAGGSNPFAKTPSRVVAVEDILVVWKAALFAGRRRNEGLGRSVGGAGSSRSSGAPTTADVRRTPRRGTSSRIRASKRMHRHRHEKSSPALRQTRPSLGPSTRARRSSLCTRRPKRLRGGAAAPASRLGKPTRVGGTFTGVGRFGRSAARRVSPLPQGRRRGTSRRGRRSRPPSLRGSEGPG